MFAVILVITTYSVTYGTCFNVFPSPVAVTQGEGLVLQVLPNNDPLQNCTVRFSGNILSLEPGNSNNTFGVSYWGRGLEQGDCGAHINSFDSNMHNGSWLFRFAFKNNSEYNALGTVTAVGAWESQAISHNVKLGEPLDLLCESSNGFYCTLSNPKQQMVMSGSNCSFTIPSVKMADIGNWVCVQGVPYAVEENVVNITVTAQPSKILDLGYNETDWGTDIFCNHLTENITFCRLERPDGKAFLMSEGRIIDRYTYFGNGISSSECGISITSPLRAVDYGTWKCTVALGSGKKSGGFISIANPQSIQLPSKDKILQKSSSVQTLAGSALTLDCSWVTSLAYCWFQHPNGTRYNPQPDSQAATWKYHGDSLMLGECGITIFAAQESDSGTWTCGIGVNHKSQLSQDQQRTIQVKVAATSLVENRTVTNAMTGDWAILACHSLQGEALSYCSFLAPNGTRYNLTPNLSRGRFIYHGSGLEYGDCGIMINPVNMEDFGLWQCRAMLATDKDGVELVCDVNLVGSSLLSSSAVGLAVGAVVACLFVVGFVVYKQRQASRLSISPNARPVALSVISDSSDDLQEANV